MSTKNRMTNVTEQFLDYKLNVSEITWTERQIEIIKQSLKDETKLTLVDGIWGSGKSLMAVYTCLKLLERRKINKIVYIRNAIQSGSGTLGWLGGDLETRLGPYFAPFYDKLEELLSPEVIEQLIKEKRIEGKPACLLRGTTFRNCGLIFDELSSFTREDILLSLSRVGENCHVWAIGDSYQADVFKSGFKEFFDLFNDQESKDNGVFAYELKEDSDVKRSEFLRFLLYKVKKSKI